MRMMKTGCLLAVLAAVGACGKSDSKDDTPATVVYGTLTTANSKTTTDNGTYQLTTADVCTRDVANGIVNVSLSQGSGKPSLTLKIKNFSATPKKYTCTQAADNITQGSTGSLFDTCMVDAKVLSAAAATNLNGYSIYRDTATSLGFTYSGACTIDVTTAPPEAKGTVTCGSMIQTTLNGAARNPIDPAMTADISATFDCTMK